MKKKKKVMALLLAFIFCFSAPAVAQAEETGTPETTTQPDVLPTEAPSKGVILDEDTNPVSIMTPYVMTTGLKADTSKAVTYLMGIYPIPDGTSSMTSYVFTISLPEAGRLNLNTGIVKLPETARAYSNLYRDAACTQSIDVSSSGWTGDILEKGTYYFKVLVKTEGPIPADADYYAFGIRLLLAPSATKPLKNGTWVTTALKNSKTPVYYKLTVPKTSKIKVEADVYDKTYITLCNSKKTPVSAESYSSGSGDPVYFVVSKGTYYLKVKSSASLFYIRAGISGVKDATGASKAKAKAIKVNGAAVKGYCNVKDKTSKAHWIKCTNNKVQQIILYVTAEMCEGEFNVEVFGMDGNSMGVKTLTPSSSKGAYTLVTKGYGFSGSTFNKGTFYVKVTKGTKKTSGTFSVRVKNK